MKDHVNKSVGIVTLITEVLPNIKTTEPLALDTQAARRNFFFF